MNIFNLRTRIPEFFRGEWKGDDYHVLIFDKSIKVYKTKQLILDHPMIKKKEYDDIQIHTTGIYNNKHYYLQIDYTDEKTLNMFFSLSEKELPYTFLFVINSILRVNKIDSSGTEGENCHYIFQRLDRVQ